MPDDDLRSGGYQEMDLDLLGKRRKGLDTEFSKARIKNYDDRPQYDTELSRKQLEKERSSRQVKDIKNTLKRLPRKQYFYAEYEQGIGFPQVCEKKIYWF